MNRVLTQNIWPQHWLWRHWSHKCSSHSKSACAYDSCIHAWCLVMYVYSQLLQQPHKSLLLLWPHSVHLDRNFNYRLFSVTKIWNAEMQEVSFSMTGIASHNTWWPTFCTVYASILWFDHVDVLSYKSICVPLWAQQPLKQFVGHKLNPFVFFSLALKSKTSSQVRKQGYVAVVRE